MNSELLWEIERVDLPWLPSGLADMATALRRHGLDMAGDENELLAEADWTGSTRIAVRIAREDTQQPSLAGGAGPPMTLVSTGRRRRELENGGHVSAVVVVPFRPAAGALTGPGETRGKGPLTFGFQASGVGEGQLSEVVIAFAGAFDLEDDVRLILFGAAPSMVETSLRRLGDRGHGRNLPDIAVESVAALAHSPIEVMIASSLVAALQPWIPVALEQGMRVIAPEVGAYREALAAHEGLLLAQSAARPTQHGGDPEIGMPRGSLEKALSRSRGLARGCNRQPLARGVGAPESADGLALGIAACAHALPPRPAPDGLMGWMTTWNTRCGIASHASNQLAWSDHHVVLAARTDDLLSPDDDKVVRCWDSNKVRNGLDQALREVIERNVTAVMIHFNWGFYNCLELSRFVAQLVARRIVVFVDMHSTVDPPEGAVLADFAPMLRSCHRVFAHGRFDIDRLLHVGVSENVFVQPLGVIAVPLRAERRPGRRGPPLIATFGYSFPNKGLLEFVEAVAVLKRKGFAVRARMLNARHPAPGSIEIVREVRRRIRFNQLEGSIEFHDEYLEEAEALSMLSEADLIVNPYQTTGESASAAVRYCMAARRPLLVTPLEIFDDLGGAVFRSAGILPEDIASGIESALSELERSSPEAAAVAEAASAWLEARDITPEASRVGRMAMAIRSNEELQSRVDESLRLLVAETTESPVSKHHAR